jgi:rubrerythrin
MALNPFREKGIPLEKQIRTWKQIALPPYRKQEVDAFTRCRVILMNGIEMEAGVFFHSWARVLGDEELKKQIALIRRIEHQQQNTVNWLNPADQSILETTVAYEQVAIELTAYLARTEPDPYVKQAFDFGLLEDFDHLYRFSQALDLIHGKDPNEILQGRTDVFPARPTQDHHNDPFLKVLKHYEKDKALPLSKVNVMTLLAGEQQTMNFYKTVGSMYGSPDVRQLYAEISEVEEEHVSQYESLMDPAETWLERWVLHEFGEVANYYTCYETEVDPRIKQVWEMFLAYELEHLRIAGEALKRMERVDPEALCGTTLPTPATFETNRAYVTDVLKATADMRLVQGGKLVKIDQLPSDWPSRVYQGMVNAGGAPSETIVQLRIDAAGGELVRVGDKSLAPQAPKYRRETLDGADAPNTAASGSTYDEQAEIQRLGELAPWVDDVKANANGGASRRNGAGKANGRTREKTAPRRSRS